MKSTQATRRRIVLLAAVTALLLFSTALSAQPGGSYAVEAGTLAGGGYRLTAVAQPGVEILSGGDYLLLSSVRSPSLRGSGCCCLYLPCIQRSQ